MLFKFKSKAASDLIMLEADARKLLKIIQGDDGVKGIVQFADLPQAIAALESAVAQEELDRQQRAEKTRPLISGEEDETVAVNSVSLSQRAAPMLKLFKRCLSEESDVVWGV
ncbi:MAG: DUF1840 domain-containing protein [Limnohabitans sp.]|jgi:hypothetical protein|nr:DUF1840 domain-containing protein [Limnohabitans sp.]